MILNSIYCKVQLQQNYTKNVSKLTVYYILIHEIK